MQDPPTLLPQMMQILQTGEYDSVATRRVSRDGEPPVRSFFARMFYKVINKISDADIVDGARDFRLMKKEMVAAIVSMNEYNRFSKGIFGWIGFKTYWLPYENVERVAGETKWNFYYGSSVSIPCFYCNQKIIVWRSCCWLGFNYMYHCFFGGIQLFSIGMIGKYVAKTYAESKHRPHYIISETNDLMER